MTPPRYFHLSHFDALTEVEYRSLNIATQEDIAANLIDRSDYLASQRWTECDLRELLADVLEPITVPVVRALVRCLRQQAANRAYSNLAVKNLAAALAACGELDPILVDGGEFVDGRHRLEAYALAGRLTIPAVDIGALLEVDWETWMDG